MIVFDGAVGEEFIELGRVGLGRCAIGGGLIVGFRVVGEEAAEGPGEGGGHGVGGWALWDVVQGMGMRGGEFGGWGG